MLHYSAAQLFLNPVERLLILLHINSQRTIVRLIHCKENRVLIRPVLLTEWIRMVSICSISHQTFTRTEAVKHDHHVKYAETIIFLNELYASFKHQEIISISILWHSSWRSESGLYWPSVCTTVNTVSKHTGLMFTTKTTLTLRGKVTKFDFISSIFFFLFVSYSP